MPCHQRDLFGSLTLILLLGVIIIIIAFLVIIIGAVIVLLLIIAPVIYCLFCRKAEARMKFGERESYFDASEMTDTTP